MLVKYNFGMNDFTVTKKKESVLQCIQLCCSLVAQTKMKRQLGLLIKRWNHVLIYSYNESIITLNRWQEGRERGKQTKDTI